MKLSAKTEKSLKCIVGLCNHTYENKSCLWNRIVDARDPRETELKILKKIIEDEVNVQIKSRKPKSK